jgi:hypothetical protein
MDCTLSVVLLQLKKHSILLSGIIIESSPFGVLVDDAPCTVPNRIGPYSFVLTGQGQLSDSYVFF